MSGPVDAVARALAKLPFADRFEGARAVARRELISNVRSPRMLAVAILMALAIVGGAAGISAFAGGGSGADTVNLLFPRSEGAQGNGSYALNVFACDVFGVPHTGYAVALAEVEYSDGGSQGPLPGGISLVFHVVANASTDGAGVARFTGLAAKDYAVGRLSERGDTFQFSALMNPAAPAAGAFALTLRQFDLEQNGSDGTLVLSGATHAGAPLGGAQVFVDGASAATLDAHGYARVKTDPGAHTVEVRSGGQNVSATASVREPSPTALQQGPDFILFFVAASFIPFIVPIAAIAVAHDAIAREKANGSIDFILSKPAARRGVLLGKFLGSSVALLLPVYATVLVGALLIASLAGKPFSWSFLGVIYGAVTLYVMSYALLLLILSTLAKNTGSAIMLGIALWVVFSIMWDIVILLVAWALGTGIGEPGYAQLAAYTGLFNPNGLFSQVVASGYPGTVSGLLSADGGQVLPSWAPLTAAVVWLIALLVLALEVFERRIAE